MPHLLATLTPGDRRAGGKHGRPAGHAAAPPAVPIRTQLLRLALIPAAAVTLCTWTTVLCTLWDRPGRPGAGSWAALTSAIVLTLVSLAAAVVGACRTADTLRDRIVGLRRGTARRHAELRALTESLQHGEKPPAARKSALTAPGHRGDELDLLAGELSRAHDAAVTAVAQAARLPREPVGTRQGRQAGMVPMNHVIEVFVTLARRLQSLAHREISLIDELENEIEDPDLLKCLFHVDHLATRMRRHAESLAVLGGAVARRRWSRPVPVVDVLRSAVAEVEQYPRVRLVPPTEGAVRGHAVADVIHLLAELIENATVFSAPHTPVLLRVCPVTSGLAVEVEDRGLGMPAPEQARMNLLLSDPARVDVAGLLRDGRIGLYVVSQLARRHTVSVRLQTNIYGGTQAVLVLPKTLLGAGDDTPDAGQRGIAAGAGADTGTPPAAGAGAVVTTTTAESRGTAALPKRNEQLRVPGQAGAPGGAGAPGVVEVPGGAGAPGVVGVPGGAAVPGEAAVPGALGALGPLGAFGAHGGQGRFGHPDGTPAHTVTGGAQVPGCVPAPPGPIGSGGSAHDQAREHAAEAPEHTFVMPEPSPAPGSAPVRAGARAATPTPPFPPAAAPPPAPTARSVQSGPATVPVPAPRCSSRAPSGGGDPSDAYGDLPGRPRLPRRQAQQHLAPQLRPAPADPSNERTEDTGATPHLMAAFRHGFGRGEAEQAPGTAPGSEVGTRPDGG
ncbi:sensor histidine kinase [Streptomyces odontomachi]|uniref:sensor histidine kinase n=1 Tax=Streptomyces odontomachi TaxID=2944940 RepID=UPI002109C53E|nr:ATP-binding protein [Streptomyces sp. ODS25]